MAILLNLVKSTSLGSSAGVADAGMTLALTLPLGIVFALPRLGFNDGDAVFDAMVFCLFVGCLELFRKALKRFCRI